MAKPPRQDRPDPLAREVDRLLASLRGIGRHPEPAPQPSPAAPVGRPYRGRTYVGGSRSGDGPTRQHLVLWAEVGLAVLLGVAMTQWPYGHACDLPLAAYLGAVAAVILAAGWVALASWRLHSAAAHILSLALLFWGTLLAAAQLLPRVGYAAERASWQCTAAVR